MNGERELLDRVRGVAHVFTERALLRQALTHRSAGRPHNERLEFLGDALLNAIVAEALFLRWPSADEGALTRLRASLVNGETLAEVARSLDLGGVLRLGPGELRSGGFRRDSILSDACEALIGAVFLDAGWEACRAVVLDLLGGRIEEVGPKEVSKDPKTLLQEYLQARQLALPHYSLVSESGQDHAPSFVARCRVESLDAETEGEGSSKRAAEQVAARRLLERIRDGGQST